MYIHSDFTEEQVHQRSTPFSRALSNLRGGLRLRASRPSMLPSCSFSSVFTYLEIDPSSFTYAEKHVTSNGLADRIRVVKVDAAGGDVEMQGQEMGLVFSFGHLFEQVPSADSGTECGNEVVEYDPEYVRVLCFYLWRSHRNFVALLLSNLRCVTLLSIAHWQRWKQQRVDGIKKRCHWG